MDVIELMKKEMLRRKYSYRTIKTYLYCVNRFLKKYNNEPNKINRRDIVDYLNKFIEKEFTGNTINVHLQALKFLVEEILHRPKTFYYVKYSKTSKRLPEVLTKEEVVKLIGAIANGKHQLMIKLIYSAGLRVSELVHLRVRDFEFDNNYGWVRSGKGNKDRLFVIAMKLKEELQNYIQKEGVILDSWLFQGNSGHHLSSRSIQEIVKKAAKKAKINKRVHPHTLRHSFSTHLIENGHDVTSVQSLLGHNSPETTMIYLHIASPKMINVISPLDGLELEK